MPFESPTGQALTLLETIHRTHTATGGTFNTASTPPLASVQSYLTMASAEIATILSKYGYDVSQSNVTVNLALMDANIRGAAWWVEMGFPSAGFAGEEAVGRLNAFSGWLKKAEDLIKTDAFRLMGATVVKHASAGLSATGISIADKEVQQQDTDAVQPQFGRDQFENPGSLDPRSRSRNQNREQ